MCGWDDIKEDFLGVSLSALSVEVMDGLKFGPGHTLRLSNYTFGSPEHYSGYTKS